MKRSRLALVFFILTSPIQAADLAGRPIAPAPMVNTIRYDWSGFYVGAQVGWQTERDRYSDIGFGSSLGTDTYVTTTKGGIVGGLHAGYNYQFGSVVLGAEGDLELTLLSYAWRDLSDPSVWGYDQKVKAQGSLRGRLGYAFDNLLLFATA